jgi:hypothetical protein
MLKYINHGSTDLMNSPLDRKNNTHTPESAFKTGSNRSRSLVIYVHNSDRGSQTTEYICYLERSDKTWDPTTYRRHGHWNEKMQNPVRLSWRALTYLRPEVPITMHTAVLMQSNLCIQVSVQKAWCYSYAVDKLRGTSQRFLTPCSSSSETYSRSVSDASMCHF